MWPEKTCQQTFYRTATALYLYLMNLCHSHLTRCVEVTHCRMSLPFVVTKIIGLLWNSSSFHSTSMFMCHSLMFLHHFGNQILLMFVCRLRKIACIPNCMSKCLTSQKNDIHISLWRVLLWFGICNSYCFWVGMANALSVNISVREISLLHKYLLDYWNHIHISNPHHNDA